MIKKTLAFLRQYWQFSTAAVVALAALGLQLWGPAVIAHWLLGIVAPLLTIPLLVEMWQEVRAGNYGLNILALTAIYTSVILHQYWVGIVIVMLLAVGQMLEDFANRRARGELEVLLEQAPSEAHVMRGRKVFDVAASSVNAGDKLIIKSGEVVPADAIILEGSASFDESVLTGENAAASRGEKDQILSGSTNLDGTVTVRALHSAADSQYRQIVRLLRSASAGQAPFVQLANRYSIPFTVAALVLAVAAWVLGHGAIRFLDVLVVATPCPLLLAAPLALTSGMSRASRQGIIIRTGSALEKLAEAETFAFDKTGTLTSGTVEVGEITAFKPYTKNEILSLAASLEQASTHILARAVVEAANEKHYSYAKAKHVQEISGRGVRAVLHGQEVLVGQLALLREHAVAVPEAVTARQTATYVAVGGKLAGVITFKDEPRPESAETIGALKRHRAKQFLLITGDTESAARAVADKVGIDTVHAQATPGDKLHLIEKIKERPVVFVGDGVNDAAVLTAADVGVALGARGSTAASEAADVVIMPDSIGLVANASGIARRTFKIARQGIAAGTLLSLLLMVIFATGHFPPLLGAVLQEVIVVLVIFNALRARLTPKSEN